MEKKRVFSKSLLFTGNYKYYAVCDEYYIYGSDKCYKYQADRSRAE